MKTTVIRPIRLGVLAVWLAVAAGFGCQLKAASYEGTTATQQDNVMIEPGAPREGRWEDSSIIVNFTYSNAPDGFEFSGSVELAPRLEKTFRTVNNFSVRANFLDEEKIILKSVPIVVASRQPIRLWRFSRNFDLPPVARSINFSYNGRAMEGGSLGPGGDGTDMFFWRVP
jgi:hypothetical protein